MDDLVDGTQAASRSRDLSASRARLRQTKNSGSPTAKGGRSWAFNRLNAQLRPPLAVGDPEFLVWRNLAREALKSLEREAA